MKLDRLFGILSVLLERERVPAAELAKRFEVSERTIYRDIAALEGAGMPVVTFPGSGGGIGILPGYKLDKRLLSKQDMTALGAALAGLTTLGGNREVKDLLEKLMPGADTALAVESDIIIDFTGWDSQSYLLRRIRILRRCIAEQKAVRIDYLTSKGRERRTVEPCKIIFKSSSWYLYAWCRLRKAFRLFKLSRMAEIAPTDETFEPRDSSELSLRWDIGASPGEGERVTLRFPARQEYLAIDLFGPDSYTALPDGSLEASFLSNDLDSVLAVLLGMSPDAEVLAPESLREMLREWARGVLRKYSGEEKLP